MKEEKTFYARNREEWRSWLKKNHEKETHVALLKYKKHTGKPSLSHKESMEEAICFGWIDTTIKRLDDERYIRRFARRGDKSRWSSATLGYARALIAQKKMSPFGLARYHEGLKKPTIDAGLAKNPPVPDDLKNALAQNKHAYANFKTWSPSYTRTYLRWIERAKQPETRKKRINAVVQRAQENKKKWL